MLEDYALRGVRKEWSSQAVGNELWCKQGESKCFKSWPWQDGSARRHDHVLRLGASTTSHDGGDALTKAGGVESQLVGHLDDVLIADEVVGVLRQYQECGLSGTRAAFGRLEVGRVDDAL